MISFFEYFVVALKASLFSTGGLGNLPSLHQDMLSRHWATDGEFASAIAIGQIAPGPTGLWVVALGYLTGGYAGASIMLLAVLLPPALVIPLDHFHAKVRQLPIARGLARGLTLAIAGAIPSILLIKVLGAYGYSWQTAALLGVSIVLLVTNRIPPLIILGTAAVAGAIVFGGQSITHT